MWNPFKKKDPLKDMADNHYIAEVLLPKMVNAYNACNLPEFFFEDKSRWKQMIKEDAKNIDTKKFHSGGTDFKSNHNIHIVMIQFPEVKMLTATRYAIVIINRIERKSHLFLLESSFRNSMVISLNEGMRSNTGIEIESGEHELASFLSATLNLSGVEPSSTYHKQPAPHVSIPSSNDRSISEAAAKLNMSVETYKECTKAFTKAEEYIARGESIPESILPKDKKAFDRYFDEQLKEVENLAGKEKIADCSPLLQKGQRINGIWQGFNRALQVPYALVTMTISIGNSRHDFLPVCSKALEEYCWWNGADKNQTQEFMAWVKKSKYNVSTFNIEEKTEFVINRARSLFSSHISELEKSLIFAMNDFEEIGFRAFFIFVTDEIGHDVANANPQIAEKLKKEL